MAPDLPLSVPRGYLPVTGAVWGVGWIGAAVALFTRRRWARRVLILCGVGFLIWYWADRLLFVRSEHALRTLPFSLALTAVGTALVLLALRQPSVRRYFGESTP